MNHKEIEQAVKGCFVSSKKRLLADKDFLHFLHYFPAGVSDEVKHYFNQAATGNENFFMVPDREDKQKAICSRCGKNIILYCPLTSGIKTGRFAQAVQRRARLYTAGADSLLTYSIILPITSAPYTIKRQSLLGVLPCTAA